MGILWPHSNSTIFNAAGVRATGAKLYFFESGTTTPRTTYSDAALTTPRTHPVVCDGYGRAPAIFLDYNDYRERVRTSGDVTIWDTDGIPNAAPFTADLNVDSTTLLQTGQFVFEPIDSTRTGYVRANGRTIGSAASVANERANADTLALYTYLYNALSNSAAPVSGGRGSNAAADFAANKTLTLPDLRGRHPFGLDTMGNSAASRFDASVPFTVGDATTAGSLGGQNHHVLTTAQLSSHTHALSGGATSAGSAHSHGVGTLATGNNSAFTMTGTSTTVSQGHTHGSVVTGGTTNTFAAGGVTGVNALTIGSSGAQSQDHTHNVTVSQDSAHTHSVTGSTANESLHTHSLSGTADANGSGSAHNNLAGALLGTWFIKL
jgi:hypothetical protein